MMVSNSISFRPLTGTLISKHANQAQQTLRELKVSVPSRGLSYLNVRKIFEKKSEQSFRPLTGTLLSKRYFHNFQYDYVCFRPLTGTLLSKLSGRNGTKNFRKAGVSVPSRGLSYLNPIFSIVIDISVIVSVPSRGLSYLNKYFEIENYKGSVSVPSRGLSYLNTIRQFSLPKRLFSLVCVANDILMIKEFNVFI